MDGNRLFYPESFSIDRRIDLHFSLFKTSRKWLKEYGFTVSDRQEVKTSLKLPWRKGDNFRLGYFESSVINTHNDPFQIQISTFSFQNTVVRNIRIITSHVIDMKLAWVSS